MSRLGEALSYEGEIAIGDLANAGAPETVGVPKVQFVRYPGCQQLILWLPQTGYFGYGELRVIGAGEACLERAAVRDRLNGSVQILWDTLAWPPGPYRIEVDHADGWRHQVHLEKFPEGMKPPEPEIEPPPAPAEDAPPIVYRDGFDKVLPNVDLEMRAKALEDIAQKFTRHLEFDGNFRAGTITYVDGATRIAFPHEMAGGRYKFTIDVPSAQHWEAVTGLPLAQRDEVVRYVAEEVQRRQASSWRFEIEDTMILFL